MKKLLVLMLLILPLSACGVEPEESEIVSTFRTDFEIVNEDTDLDFYEYRHIKTGCHYLENWQQELTQMFIEKDGKAVPYCD